MRPDPEALDDLWEWYHENSKLRRGNTGPSNEEVLERMKHLHESLLFSGYPSMSLPKALCQPPISLTEAVVTRTSSRKLKPRALSMNELATLLYYSYGVSRRKVGTSLPRSLRVVPSGGALYPLELFFTSSCLTGLPNGLYHYCPSKNSIRHIRANHDVSELGAAIPFPDLIEGAAVLIFITALFERSVFKYGERGYRFALIEAGHVAQNLNLISTALGLGSVNIGGYYDRDVDEYLGLDGIKHSTIYVVAIGHDQAKKMSKKYRRPT